jgi:hypothetical protein
MNKFVIGYTQDIPVDVFVKIAMLIQDGEGD